jgi:AraC-like DNA-binding protein
VGEILGPGEGLSKPERNRRIVRAHLAHGYTLAEIARHGGLHYTTVSKIVKAATL